MEFATPMNKGDPIYLQCPRCFGRVLVVDGVKPICPGCASTDLVRPDSPRAGGLGSRRIFWVVMVLGIGVVIWFYVGWPKGTVQSPAPAAQAADTKPKPPEPLPEVGIDQAGLGGETKLPDGNSQGQTQSAPPKVISPARPGGVVSPPGGAREDEADPREVARLHRMVAVAAAKMESDRRELAGKIGHTGVSGNFQLAGIQADPMAAEKAFRTVLQTAQDGEKAAESLAANLRTEIREAVVGDPARRRGIEFFHAVTGKESEIWTELVAVLREATAEVPVLAILMRRAVARDAEGGLVFRNPADQATWKERVQAFALLDRRWLAVQGKLRAPAAVPPAPALPVRKDEADSP